MTERPNIRRMQVPEKISDSERFDAKRDISPAAWQGIFTVFEADRRADNKTILILRAADIKVLAPERLPVFSETEVEKMETAVSAKKDSGMIFYDYLGDLKSIVTDRDIPIKGNRDEARIFLEGEWRAEAYYPFAVHAASVKICQPELIDQIVHEGKLQILREKLAEYRKSKVGIAEPFTDFSVAMRILDPEQPLVPTAVQWTALKEHLKQIEKTGTRWGSYAHLARGMQILAADELRITHKGLEVRAAAKKHSDEEAGKMPESLQL